MVLSDTLTAKLLSKNFKEIVKQFVAQNKAYSLMSTTNGTPACGKKFMKNVMVMVKNSWGYQHFS